ncbi:hypothetical protein [Candidatus Uabimicrobium sp. HlEnr_7]|uniref:hypothetical protein n=1 Tax=Candidatus Uabimicrobium helgolandensis TaxID=3095367 RepID=UPI003555C36A
MAPRNAKELQGLTISEIAFFAEECVEYLSEDKINLSLMKVEIRKTKIAKSNDPTTYCVNVVEYLLGHGKFAEWLLVLHKDKHEFVGNWLYVPENINKMPGETTKAISENTEKPQDVNTTTYSCDHTKQTKDIEKSINKWMEDKRKRPIILCVYGYDTEISEIMRFLIVKRHGDVEQRSIAWQSDKNYGIEDDIVEKVERLYKETKKPSVVEVLMGVKDLQRNSYNMIKNLLLRLGSQELLDKKQNPKQIVYICFVIKYKKSELTPRLMPPNFFSDKFSLEKKVKYPYDGIFKTLSIFGDVNRFEVDAWLVENRELSKLQREYIKEELDKLKNYVSMKKLKHIVKSCFEKG